MKFAAMGFAPEILKALEQSGYQVMTPVQEQAMVEARRGRDLWVNAQTGTGKTAAFALPMLQHMLDQPKAVGIGKVRSLILTPTRELAEQLAQTISGYAQHLDFKITAVYGGVKISGQANKIKAGIDVLIATPGRLLELLETKQVNLADVDTVVLDEADRLLDMGFIAAAEKIISFTAEQHQTMLFSATTTAAMNELAHKMLSNHLEVRVSKANVTAETVEHVMYPVSEDQKMDLFMELLEQHNWYQILVFTSTKKQADHLLERLKKVQIPAAICHGDKSQGSRRRALADFKSAKLQVLISTEVAARGLDIEGLDYVLNYNLPYLPEDYVHRIGRTGRAGKSGHAISFVCPEESRALQRIERVIGGEVKRIYQRGYALPGREEIQSAAPIKPKASKAKSNKSQTAGKANKSGQAKRKTTRKSITSRAGGKSNRKAIKKNR